MFRRKTGPTPISDTPAPPPEPIDFSNLQRVQTGTGGGTHIEPAFDDTWSELDKLRWNLRVMQIDCGLDLPIQVFKAHYERNGVLQDGYYGFQTPNSSWTAYDYHAAWDFINGVRLGAELAQAMSAPTRQEVPA